MITDATTAHLRFLATHPDGTIPEGVAQAILALLDQNDHTWEAYRLANASRNAAERRVASLHKAARALIDSAKVLAAEETTVATEKYVALAEALAAAPSEPLRLGQQVAIESHLPRDLQEQADAIRDPAALPAEVGE